MFFNLWKKIQLRRGMCYYGEEYWVRLDDINVDFEYCEENVNRHNLRYEVNYWYNTGVYKTRILLDRNFKLVDGYMSYLVAKKVGEEMIPVIFVDTWGWKVYESNN